MTANAATRILFSLALLSIGSACGGQVTTEKSSGASNAGGSTDAATHQSPHDTGTDHTIAEASPDVLPDRHTEPGCDPTGVPGHAICCNGTLCRGDVCVHGDCICGLEIPGGCPANSYCCGEDEPEFSSCHARAFCEGTTTDPGTDEIVLDAGGDCAPTGWGASVSSCCDGKPCKGRCIRGPNGKPTCSCFGILGGCLGDLQCCTNTQSCGVSCGVLPPR